MSSQPNTLDALRDWIKTLPASKMVHPTASLADRLKYTFWRVYTPFHHTVRDVFVWLGIRRALFIAGVITYGERQDFLLGHVAPQETHRSLIEHLLREGYGNHFVAWKDSGELVSLRKALDFRYQYHLRIFEDGEVRGHYEYTPEYRPWRHLREVGQEDHRIVFLELLGDRIVPANG